MAKKKLPAFPDCVFARSGKGRCDEACQAASCVHYAVAAATAQDPQPAQAAQPAPTADPVFPRTCEGGHSFASAFGHEPCPECGKPAV